jgi:hypothetical protein
MRTPKQTAASRANGARSKGPITPNGKASSSRNSTRHGLFAQTIVLEREDMAQFLQLFEDLSEEHQPQTRTENMLVETLAASIWRRDRIWGMQKVAFDHDVSSCNAEADHPALQAVLALRGSPDSVRSHELMLRYEIALDRQISRALLRLQQLQEKASAKGAARTAPADQSTATPSKKDVPTKRTQQPIESKVEPPLSPASIPPSTSIPLQPHSTKLPSGRGAGIRAGKPTLLSA